MKTHLLAITLAVVAKWQGTKGLRSCRQLWDDRADFFQRTQKK
jgi:hypothetical protein